VLAQALAAFEGRTEVTPGDIYRVIPLCLRHRLRKDPMAEIDTGDKVGVGEGVGGCGCESTQGHLPGAIPLVFVCFMFHQSVIAGQDNDQDPPLDRTMTEPCVCPAGPRDLQGRV